MLLFYLQIPQDWMIFNAREKHSHRVGSVVEERDPSSIQVTRQLMDVCLQLCKGWHKNRTTQGAVKVQISLTRMGKTPDPHE